MDTITYHARQMREAERQATELYAEENSVEKQMEKFLNKVDEKFSKNETEIYDSDVGLNYSNMESVTTNYEFQYEINHDETLLRLKNNRYNNPFSEDQLQELLETVTGKQKLLFSEKIESCEYRTFIKEFSEYDISKGLYNSRTFFDYEVALNLISENIYIDIVTNTNRKLKVYFKSEWEMGMYYEDLTKKEYQFKDTSKKEKYNEDSYYYFKLYTNKDFNNLIFSIQNDRGLERTKYLYTGSKSEEYKCGEEVFYVDFNEDSIKKGKITNIESGSAQNYFNTLDLGRVYYEINNEILSGYNLSRTDDWIASNGERVYKKEY